LSSTPRNDRTKTIAVRDHGIVRRWLVARDKQGSREVLRMKLARISVVSIIVGALAASCGSGSKSGTGGSAGTGGSSGVGGSAGSGGTAGSGGSSGSGGTHGSGGTMGSPPMDSGTEDAMHEGGNKDCPGLATHADCKKCCTSAFPVGQKGLVKDELTCACTAALCGPGGTAGVDSGMFGDESCASSCGAAKPLPLTPHCEACVEKAMGSVPKPGTCRPTVKTACEADVGCKNYMDCIDKCPP